MSDRQQKHEEVSDEVTTLSVMLFSDVQHILGFARLVHYTFMLQNQPELDIINRQTYITLESEIVDLILPRVVIRSTEVLVTVTPSNHMSSGEDSEQSRHTSGFFVPRVLQYYQQWLALQYVTDAVYYPDCSLMRFYNLLFVRTNCLYFYML